MQKLKYTDICVLMIVASRNPCPFSEIIEKVPITTAWRSLKRLIERGFVEKVGRGYYVLTIRGKEYLDSLYPLQSSL